MNKRILFLDDSIIRTEYFLHEYPHADTAMTAQECIDKLSVNRYDVISLDHDLGDAIHVGSAETNTGMEVVRWILENKPKLESICIHSFNGAGAERMCLALIEAGYKAFVRPFTFRR